MEIISAFMFPLSSRTPNVIPAFAGIQSANLQPTAIPGNLHYAWAGTLDRLWRIKVGSIAGLWIPAFAGMGKNQIFAANTYSRRRTGVA